MRNSHYTKWALPKTPLWIAQLYKYEIDQIYDRGYVKQISLAGTINPDSKHYVMKGFPMTNYILKGMAELEEYVEVELTAETEDEARELASKELLQTHPEYIDVAWTSVNAQ
jgi:hypothetical protein